MSSILPAVVVLALQVQAVVSAANILRNDDGLLVNTTIGMLKGHVNGAGVREWKGIRFGEAPVNELRWASPVPASPYSDVFEADFDAPGCPQICNLPPGTCPLYGTSEDCLFLNVYAPAKSADTKQLSPVFFWIHGGAYEQGIGASALYNGSTMAQLEGGVVTVAVNYRLGALGFMGTSAPAKKLAGNYGVEDQMLALQWVINNIEAFGGDPNQITIAGQSAGAMSTSCLMVAPSASGMFQRVVMESNPLGLPYHTRESAGNNAAAVFEYCGCAAEDVECMRTKDVDLILEAQNNAVKLNFDDLLLNFLPFTPLVEEGGMIPEQPLTALAAGHQQDYLPMLQGSLYDEGQLFVYELFTSPLGESAYNFVVEAVFGRKASKDILALYPFGTTNQDERRGNEARKEHSEEDASYSRRFQLLREKVAELNAGSAVEDGTDGREALNVLATDLLFYCPLRNVTRGYQRSYSSEGKMPQSFVYRFKHVVTYDMWGPDYSFCVGYVCHGSELPTVFNVYTDGDQIVYEPTEGELQLARDMNRAWANFMRTGDPNLGLPDNAVAQKYPAYEETLDALAVLDDHDAGVLSQVRAEYCDMWDRLGYFY